MPTQLERTARWLYPLLVLVGSALVAVGMVVVIRAGRTSNPALPIVWIGLGIAWVALVVQVVTRRRAQRRSDGASSRDKSP
ncbi:hypothetical protein [Nakamurella endophytica]|nr:hypothetical protein [Nakamurella endophytica]